MITLRVAPILLCSALVACGDSKPAADAAPAASSAAIKTAPPPAMPSVSAAMASPPGPSPTLLGVQLDPSVAGPCKIDAPKGYFEYDAGKLKGPDVAALNTLAMCLTKGALKGKSVEMVGHTNEKDDADFHKSAGTSRAQAVANYLEAQNVTKGKLKAILGEAPKGKAAGEGLAPERRVDVRLGK